MSLNVHVWHAAGADAPDSLDAVKAATVSRHVVF